MNPEHFDFIIVGAGIHGAGLAQAAAVKGHRVLVLEKNTVASGTSSRSSKLIHGGLRYLENFQAVLVRECLRERELLLRNAPGLVRLQAFYFPVYTHTRRRAWQLRVGLSVYALLGGLAASSRYQRINLSSWPNPDGLRSTNLQALFRYQDGITDDAALTQAVMQSALTLGAQLCEHALFQKAHFDGSQWRVQFRWQDQERYCQAPVLLVAAGPWSKEVTAHIQPRPVIPDTELVQGTHIYVPGTLHEGVYYVESPLDRRVVFIIPREGRIMIGTTEKIYSGSPDAVAPSAEEIDYLYATFAHYFPGHAGGKASMLDAFAGLRVLPKGKSQATGRSRDTLVVFDKQTRPHLAIILGGKLTAYRSTSENVLNRFSYLPAPHPAAGTADLIIG